jgi:hypothetical protein
MEFLWVGKHHLYFAIRLLYRVQGAGRGRPVSYVSTRCVRGAAGSFPNAQQRGQRHDDRVAELLSDAPFGVVPGAYRKRRRRKVGERFVLSVLPRR